ncbi:MAG: hypothetical protein ACFE85_06270 [Candidatus Hodarchaeota archaeon]
MSIPSEDVIINSLNHEIRREILRLLKDKKMSYSNLLDHFAIATGKLNYHIKLLTGFIDKDSEGLYTVTKLGVRLISLLNDLNKSITEEDRPLLKKAYISQVGSNKSFLRIRLVGGIYFKITAVFATVILIIVMTVLYAIEGVNILSLWPLYLLLALLVPVGLYWAFKLYKPAKEFADRVDKLLENSE